MPSKLMLVYFAFDLLYLGSGALILGFSLTSESLRRSPPSTENVARGILLDQCPLTAGIVNAILIFLTFLLTLPAFFIPSKRIWLKLHGWLLLLSALFTLSLGLTVWFETLRTRSKLASVWASESPGIQSLLQAKFDCCGYTADGAPLEFVRDATCQNGLVAAQKGACVGPFSNDANSFLDLVFTALFGFVALDCVLILCVAMVNRLRVEQMRYRHIDEKNRE